MSILLTQKCSSVAINKHKIAKRVRDAVLVITQCLVRGIPFPDSRTLEIFLDYKK